MTDLRARLDAHLGDRYEVVRELGAGGMATVFLATDTKHGREVALKVLRPEVAGALGAERFLREIQTVARLTHPHILPLHDSGEAGGLLYYVMPYVEGESLRERLERDGALPIEEALRITAECAEALEHAHQEGIIHRDLKPANILFSGGQPVVADFGIGRAVEGAADEQALTRTGISLGTVGYMSPEQTSGERAVDARSDVYALGCVLYEMLTGERAFPGRTAQAVMARQLTEAPPTVSVLRRGVPEAVERVLQGALQPNPADRYGTAAEFRAELAVAQQAGEPRARRAPLRLMRRPAVAGVGLLTLGALAYAGFVYTGGGTAEPGNPEIRSLAVLPLENLAPDPQAEQYFADGMTEALTTELGQISALTVISRTSATRARGTDKSLPEIAEELGVDGLIEGSVLQAGDEVRITLQLVDGVTARHLWSHSYERELRDVLALQSEVARAIAEEIEVTVAPEEEARLASARPVDPEAYRLYLRGNFRLTRLDSEAFRRALDSYREAVEIDPGYAAAWAGVAMAYVEQGSWWADAPRSEILPKARDAIGRALALDSMVAEAYVARGRIRHLFEWDWEGADQAFRRGIALNPSATYARILYGHFLTTMGRFEESIEVGRRTLEIDPLSPTTYNELGFAHWLAGRDDEALELYREGLEIEPGIQGHAMLAQLRLRQGDVDRALPHLSPMGGSLETMSASVMALPGHLYGVAGRRDEALDILSRLMERRRTERVPAGALAQVFVGLGEHEQALRWLEDAYEERDVNLVWLKAGPWYDPLRSYPEFQSLLERMEFPES